MAIKIYNVYTKGMHIGERPALNLTYFDEVMSLAPIAYYRWSDDSSVAVDETDALNGTYYGNPTEVPPLTVDDATEKAISLNGTDQYAVLGLERELSDRTQKTEVVVIAQGTGPLLSNKRTENLQGPTILQVTADGHVQIYILISGSSPYAASYTSSGTVNVNQPYMVGFALIENQYKLYLNGVLDSTFLANHTYVNQTGTFSILEAGRWHNHIYSESYFSGTMDDLVIFDKELTEENHATLYQTALIGN